MNFVDIQEGLLRKLRIQRQTKAEHFSAMLKNAKNEQK